MNCADMILDSVSVANLDEVNLSDMVASGVNIPKFTWLVVIITFVMFRFRITQDRLEAAHV